MERQLNKMKKILTILGLFLCIVSYSQVDSISNGESGLSTRNKLNRVIDTVNNYVAMKDTLQYYSKPQDIIDSITNALNSVDSIVFTEQSTALEWLKWKMFADSAKHTVSLHMDATGVTLQIGMEMYIYARNVSGATMDNFTAARITGSTGEWANMDICGIGSPDSADFAGLATHSIPNNEFGFFTTYGSSRDGNSSQLTQGKKVYLSYAGGLRSDTVDYPLQMYQVGYCIRSHSTTGEIMVNTDKTQLNHPTGSILYVNGNREVASDTTIIRHENGRIFIDTLKTDVYTDGSNNYTLAQLASSVDSSRIYDSLILLQTQIDTLPHFNDLDTTLQNAKDYADNITVQIPTNTPRDSIPIYDSIVALRGDIGSGGGAMTAEAINDSLRVNLTLDDTIKFNRLITTYGQVVIDTDTRLVPDSSDFTLNNEGNGAILRAVGNGTATIIDTLFNNIGDAFDNSDGTENLILFGFFGDQKPIMKILSTYTANIIDSVAPTFAVHSISDTTSTGAVYDVQINENGTVYWSVLPDSVTPNPSKAEIAAGTGASDYGNVAVIADATSQENITGLTDSTDYRLFSYAVDGESNETPIQSSLLFLTDPASSYVIVNAEYQAIYDSMQTKPTGLYVMYQDSLCGCIKNTAQFWDSIDYMNVYAIESNATNDAQMNWVAPGRADTSQLINNPTFTSLQGFTGNGTNSYINTLFNLVTDATNFVLDNGSLSIYSRTSDSYNIIGVGPIRTYIYTNGGYSINQSTPNSYSPADFSGFWTATRRSASDVEFYRNGSSVDNSSAASTSVPNYAPYVLSRNNGGTADSFSSAEVSLIIISKGMSDETSGNLNTCIETYMDAIGTGVEP